VKGGVSRSLSTDLVGLNLGAANGGRTHTDMYAPFGLELAGEYIIRFIGKWVDIRKQTNVE
jgi:hypothetical protein